jgi:spore coat polysaccharide biosynthesis protein SpsF
MAVGAIVVCRLDSERLPAKVLRTVNGKPLLWYVISRCKLVTELNNNIIVATSNRGIDEPIVEYCKSKKLKIFCGSAEDVSGRVLNCAQANKLKYFFRVNADSPFLEPSLLKHAWDIILSSDYDFVTNLYPRSFPYGVSVELIKTDAFRTAYQHMTVQEHFEHVTSFIYQNISHFRYFNILREGDNLSNIRLTIDTEDDWRIFKPLITKAKIRWDSPVFLDAIKCVQK